MFILGSSAIAYRRRREDNDRIAVYKEVTRRDLSYFLPMILVAGVTGYLPLPLWAEIVVALALVAVYAYYVRQTLKSGSEEQEGGSEDLMIWLESKWGQAPNWALGVQVAGSIALMVVGAYYFVHAVEQIAHAIGVPVGLIALLLAPLATELPEKANSIYWMRANKDPIAAGNMTGAMVFQASIPVALGLVFTPWDFGFRLYLAVGMALFSAAILYLLLRMRRPIRGHHLLGGGLLYLAFVAIAIYTVVVPLF